ncbi:MAG: hypothetical protein Q8S09_16950 [Hyphomonas sp.]|nr:hypothetical protein [Hyphomonas sp.]MDP3460962.1 hypothetical protein [Hyphomonas sp.]
MIESVIIAIIKQAAALTKPQQDEFTTKVAEAIATLIRGTETGIDNELVRQVGLPIGGDIIVKLRAII